MTLSSEQLIALRSVPLGSAANKIRVARAMCEIKQTDLAAATGFTSPQLSDIERGEYKDIPLENCRRLATFFGCAVEDLFPPRQIEETTEQAAERDRRAGIDRRTGEDRRTEHEEHA